VPAVAVHVDVLATQARADDVLEFGSGHGNVRPATSRARAWGSMC
jgi:hypothetical protein